VPYGDLGLSMGKKLPNTPKSRIRSTLRQLWLRSRERAAALKRDKYTCQSCFRKQTTAKGKEFKVQVHHIDGIDWEDMIKYIQENLLQTPDSLTTLCKDCHDLQDHTFISD